MPRGMQPPFWFTLVYFKIAELRKTTTVRTKSVCTHAGGVCLKMEDISLSFILVLINIEM